MKKRTVFVLVLGGLIGMGNFLFADNNEEGGMGGPYIGIVKYKTTEINEFLEENQYPTLPSRIFIIGGGGYGMTDDVLLGGDGEGGSYTATKGENGLRLDFGGGGFSPATISGSGNFYIGINITIGGWGNELLFFKGRESFLEGKNLLEDPGFPKITKINSGSFLVKIGLVSFYKTNFMYPMLKVGWGFLPQAQWKDDLGRVVGGIPEIKSFTYGNLGLMFGGEGD